MNLSVRKGDAHEICRLCVTFLVRHVCHYLCSDNLLHDGAQRIVEIAFLNPFEPSVTVLIGLLERNIQVVIRLFCRQILEKKNEDALSGAHQFLD